jgi:hypothetical protein
MPLIWQNGINPYIFNYFGKLQIGPNAPPANFQPQAKRFVQKLAAGETIELAGQRLDEHAVNEASRKLLDPRVRASELLLIHPQLGQSGKPLKTIADQIRRETTLPSDQELPPLSSATAAFWFIPQPGPEAAELPPFEAFGLVAAGDEADLQLDIVFDE